MGRGLRICEEQTIHFASSPDIEFVQLCNHYSLVGRQIYSLEREEEKKGLGFGDNMHTWPGVRHRAINGGTNWKSAYRMGRLLKAFPS